MPRFDAVDMETVPVVGTNFQYSAVRLDKLGATEYTLVSIVLDISGSVASYKDELEKCVAEIVKSCKYSPRADNLMLRLITFNSSEKEEHGFKLLADCNPDDYLGSLYVGGSTALFDASFNAIEVSNAYGKSLTDNDFSVNAIIFVITDGEDNASTYPVSKIKTAIEQAVKGETMESIVSILIGVGGGGITTYLQNVKDQAGFTQYVDLGDATDKKLAKLAQFVSKSISSQSQSLGTGGPSQAINMTF